MAWPDISSARGGWRARRELPEGGGHHGVRSDLPTGTSHFSSLTSRARLGCCTTSAPDPYTDALAHAAAHPARGLRRTRRCRGGYPGQRVLRRLPRPPREPPPPRSHRVCGRCAEDLFESALGCARARRSSPARATSRSSAASAGARRGARARSCGVPVSPANSSSPRGP